MYAYPYVGYDNVKAVIELSISLVKINVAYLTLTDRQEGAQDDSYLPN